jgi:hypothetical protein
VGAASDAIGGIGANLGGLVLLKPGSEARDPHIGGLCFQGLDTFSRTLTPVLYDMGPLLIFSVIAVD